MGGGGGAWRIPLLGKLHGESHGLVNCIRVVWHRASSQNNYYSLHSAFNHLPSILLMDNGESGTPLCVAALLTIYPDPFHPPLALAYPVAQDLAFS